MSSYTLLGQTVTFSDSEERFCSLQFFSWKVGTQAREEFEKWYAQQGSITAVLNQYPDKVEELVKKYALNTLYDSLTEVGIYDISKATYIDRCVTISNIAIDTYDETIECYNSIIDQLEAEIEYRELRKACRTEVIGGGFGLGGAIKGIVTAGAINATTGAAHSIANSIGNAGSEDDANRRKAQLFNQSKENFCRGITSSVGDSVFEHLLLVNEHIADYYVTAFDRGKGEGLLESAKKVADKRRELLIDSFKNCPWLYSLYEYIIEEYPEERKSLLPIAQRFSVDLSGKIEEIISREYTDAATKNEEEAQKARQRILAIMEELGVEESDTLTELEYDCLDRLCGNIYSLSEVECNELLQKINAYNAREKIKTEYRRKVQERIEIIWAKEDGDVFDNYMLSINILAPDASSKGVAFVNEKSRTAKSQKYIAAFQALSYDNIKKARTFHAINKNGAVLKYIGWALIIVGIIFYLAQEDVSFWTQILPIALGGIYQYYIHTLQTKWKTITLDGKVVHKFITISAEEFESENRKAQNQYVADYVAKKEEEQSQC